eukprot:TRINITY_DN2615_c0_g1_i1.p1 TRINITY_DN2615_c0_g1~~TRINITY_DN2615_c0_g1_i1.p1  ORF type:complete len:146 (-),score=32.73 TRINITY_DN2615_c0_g1_i1:98-535(-)
MKAILVLCLIFVSALAGPFTWKSCGTSSDHFQPTNVVMSPYPAVAGTNVTTHATGAQDETVTGGSWTTTVYLGVLPVETYKGPACELIPGCPCPCKSGHYTTSLTLAVPSFALTDTYTGKFTAVDQNGAQLVCIEYTFDIVNNGV